MDMKSPFVDAPRLTKKRCQRQRETNGGKPLSDTIRLRRACDVMRVTCGWGVR